MKGLQYILTAFTLIAIAGYIGIDLVVDLPLFLRIENVVWAFLYLISLYRIHRDRDVSISIAVSGVNLGRVSRSIVDPRGVLGRLWMEHIPLASLISLILITSLIYYYKARGR